MRALGTTKFFLKELMDLSDIQTQAFVTSNGVSRWTAYRMDMQAFYISTIFAGITMFYSIPRTPGELAVAALGFQMAMECARHFNTAIRWTFQIELNLVSIQRLLQYINLEPEETDKKFSEQMESISKGDIEFKETEMKYQAHLQPAIQNLSFKINQGEKVAVVGRTGAGKSSVLQILFGFRQVSNGQVIIGGKNIDTISKKSLRSALNVVF